MLPERMWLNDQPILTRTDSTKRAVKAHNKALALKNEKAIYKVPKTDAHPGSMLGIMNEVDQYNADPLIQHYKQLFTQAIADYRDEILDLSSLLKKRDRKKYEKQNYIEAGVRRLKELITPSSKL